MVLHATRFITGTVIDTSTVDVSVPVTYPVPLCRPTHEHPSSIFTTHYRGVPTYTKPRTPTDRRSSDPDLTSTSTVRRFDLCHQFPPLDTTTGCPRGLYPIRHRGPNHLSKFKPHPGVLGSRPSTITGTDSDTTVDPYTLPRPFYLSSRVTSVVLRDLTLRSFPLTTGTPTVTTGDPSVRTSTRPTPGP